MQLYNTLTRKLEQFEPQNPPEVTLYTCGFTAYDYAHIGNAMAYVSWDTLRRVLQESGYEVSHVMNITDVGHLVSDADEGEDKLEKGARRTNKSVWEIAEYYTEAFKEDMLALNILPPNAHADHKRHDTYARATDFVPQQIEMVETLLKKGFAYQTKQAIYFDVTKLPSYGELSGQKLADKQEAVRDEVVTDPEKRNPYDFSVWFFTVGHFADHSMHWPSPWGEGFPGWHLECSAIIHSTLGDPIDIHTGGIDHIGTHHTNEMAQTEAAFGHRLANFWLHNNFILVDGGKMSKSKQNFYTLKDITDRGFSPLAYRLRLLQSHYRSETNFTWQSLEAAQNLLVVLRAFADLRFQLKEGGELNGSSFFQVQQVMTEELQRDLNTPGALAALNDLVTESETNMVAPDAKQDFAKFLEFLDRVLGLRLLDSHDITNEQKQLITSREQARGAKNFAKSDEIRDTLAKQGIGLRDTPLGTIWYRT